MSRLGKQPIKIPEGVVVTSGSGVLTVQGSKGTLTRALVSDVTLAVENGEVTLTPKQGSDRRRHYGVPTQHIFVI